MFVLHSYTAIAMQEFAGHIYFALFFYLNFIFLDRFLPVANRNNDLRLLLLETISPTFPPTTISFLIEWIIQLSPEPFNSCYTTN